MLTLSLPRPSTVHSSAKTSQDVVVNRKVIGSVYDRGELYAYGLRFHAAFKPHGRDTEFLCQGFGDTPEAAIRSALINKRHEMTAVLEALPAMWDSLLNEVDPAVLATST
jgi:hypothetical protein